MVSIAGSMSADKLTIQGHASIGGGFSGEELDVEGYLSVAENCQAETCVMDGGFTINGLLNAGTIQIKLHGSCRAKEIGGDAIRVKKGKNRFWAMPSFPFVSFTPKLTADTIEGDEIYLEATQARIVRGNNVAIGPGCEIERVEYKGVFQQDKGARVTSNEKM
jgi:cytoskeletal protein CcmA (bactofilin family)